MNKYLHYTLLLFILPWNSHAQRYPVQSTVQLVPPYSLSLDSYTAPGSDQLRLTLLLLDLEQPTYDVRLRFVLEGTGLRIETSPAYNPPPLTLEAGAPTLLSGPDLSNYLDVRNLVFSGITRQEYERRGVLPEGFYRFSFIVEDYRRPGVPLARESSTQAWLALGEPPLLNTPFCGSEVTFPEGQQNFIFQWSPIGTSPNAALDTEYELTLVEIRPAGRNPFDALNTTVPLYQVTTGLTSVVYGITEPPLIPGLEYAWRVQARDITGLDRFKNNGYSRVCTFRVPVNAVELDAPGGLTAEGETERSARVTWRPVEEGNGYRVEYREADNPTAEWFGQDVFSQEGELVITNLRPGTEYEVQVGTIRERYAGSWSEKVRFRTLAPRVMACGDPTAIEAPTNTRPLTTAMVGDIFQVGQFEMVVTSIRGGDGRFNGTGAVLVPYLGFRVNSTFTDLRVNENKEVIDGEVIALSEGIDGLVDRWEEGEEGTGDGEGDAGGADVPGEDEDIFEGEEIAHEGEIDSVYLNGDGQIVVVDEGGEETVYEQGVDEETGEPVATRVVGEDGEEWVVDDQGNVTKGSPSDVSDVPGGPAETDSVLFVQKELIKEVLQHFKEEINLWLENNGKGPLDEALVRRLMALPDCLPEDENKMQEVLIKIDEFLEDPEALLNLIKEDDMNKARIEELTAKLTGDQSPYAAGLLKEEWDELLHMICPYLVVEKERPELVTIESINDLEFTSGINNDKLEIQYSIQTSEAYPLSHAKFQIYKNDGTLIYESDPIEIKIDGREQWDGQMNQGDRNGEFIRYDDGEFTVKVLASLKKEFGNSFEASTNARVDIDADKWRDFDHQDIGVESKYWSFDTFKDLKTKYETSLEEISDEHPLDYLNESLVPVKFLEQGPFLLNIRFGYVLKLFEQSLSDSKRSEYESFLTTVSFDSKLRMTSLGNGISNHALGFALDLDAPENPMITDTYIYHFIEFVTGVENFYGRRERTNAFIDELKSAHNTFVDRLNLKSGNPVTWEDLVESAEKIEAFENRKSHIQTSPLYFLADVANNTPLGDIDTIRESVERLNDAKITEEEILANCDDALAQLELNEIQITALQRVVTEYEKGMLREYYIPTELASLKEYLDVATEQIEINRTNINELKEYVALNNIQQLFQDFLNYLNELFEDEEKTAEFDKMSQLNDLNNHITALYNGFKTLSSSLDTYKKYIEKIKERVNQAGPQYGKKLMEEGFFNLRSDFITDWFAIDYTYWGGFYGPNHDFMHLEVVNSYKQNALDRLHQQDLEFYKNFFQENYPEEYSKMFNE